MSSPSNLAHVGEDILHYSFSSISEHIQQIDYFTDISSQAAFDNGTKSNLAKILVKPVFKFVQDYFFKRGFLDGYYGLVIAVNSAHAKFLKYSKLKDLQKR